MEVRIEVRMEGELQEGRESDYDKGYKKDEKGEGWWWGG